MDDPNLQKYVKDSRAAIEKGQKDFQESERARKEEVKRKNAWRFRPTEGSKPPESEAKKPPIDFVVEEGDRKVTFYEHDEPAPPSTDKPTPP
jgi:hypothetical protein